MLSDPRTVFGTPRRMLQNHLRGPRITCTTDFDKINLDRAMQIYGAFGNAWLDILHRQEALTWLN